MPSGVELTQMFAYESEVSGKIFSGSFRKKKIREAIWENRTGNGGVPE